MVNVFFKNLPPKSPHFEKKSSKNSPGYGLSPIQYLMQAFTGMEERLSNIEASAGEPGIDPKIIIILL